MRRLQRPRQPHPHPRPPVATEDDDIAIVGMACRFPGAKNLSEYWHLMESGTDAVTDGRQAGDSQRDVAENPNSENTSLLRGCVLLRGSSGLNSRFFHIAPIEARMMDPQQRMMLETSWEAVEDAGIAPDSLRGSRTGVYAGVTASEYRHLIEASGRVGSQLGTAPSNHRREGRVGTGSWRARQMAIDMGLRFCIGCGASSRCWVYCGASWIWLLPEAAHAVLSTRRFPDSCWMWGCCRRADSPAPFDASADGPCARRGLRNTRFETAERGGG